MDGLLKTKFGIKRGAELSVELAKAAGMCKTDAHGAYAFVTEYNQLDLVEQDCVISRLVESGVFDPLVDALGVLASHYPFVPA